MPGRICKDFEETVKAGKTPPFRFLHPPLNLCKSLLIFKFPIHFFFQVRVHSETISDDVRF